MSDLKSNIRQLIEKVISNSPEDCPLKQLIPTFTQIEWQFDFNKGERLQYGDLSTTAVMKMVSCANKANQTKLCAVSTCKLASE